MIKQQKRIPFLKIISVGLIPSFLKIWIYRFKGAKIGKGVHLAIGSVIIGNEVELGDYSTVGFFSVIIGNKIRIGNYVNIGSMSYIKVDQIEIDDDVVIRDQVLVGGMEISKSLLSIGKQSHIHRGCFINTTMPVKIGKNTAIGGGSYIFTHSSWQSKLEGYPCTFAPVSVKDNVWIAWNVFIMPGVNIGNGTLITAGSVVTKSLPEKCLARGNPARVVIPSGEFPRQIDISDKDPILRKIFDEFWRYLRNYDFRIEIEKENPELIAKVFKKRRRLFTKKASIFKFIYSPYGIHELKTLAINSISVLLSLNALKDSFRSELCQAGCMWLDLATHQRGGSNDFGEELVKFLGHYGIRFERTE